jgi:signal-transduction protein with cAMP-binding, CBS, and nucleotidyltransferase domain
MIVQKAELFKDLSPETMNEISKIMLEESYETSSSVFKSGAPSKDLFILVGGRIR